MNGSRGNPTYKKWLSLIERIFYYVTHIAGFACLVAAGATFNKAIGLVVAGISCFVFAWLVTLSSSNNEDNDNSQTRLRK
jgi:hypothetical protein